MNLPSTDPALPNFSRVAAVIADPTRARMLAALLCGEYRSAGELATVAGITAQAASTQLAQFGMLMRCGYLHEPAPNPPGRSGPGSPPGLKLSNAGSMWVARLGLTLPNKTASRFAYPCMDWSERKDHLAGILARALLEHYLAKNWLRSEPGARALNLTPQGQRELMPLLNEMPP